MESGITRRWNWPHTILILLATAALLVAGFGAPARPDHKHGAGQHRAAPSRNQRQPSITASQAAQRAGDRYGGKVLNVILEHGPGGPYYQVKLLDGGRVRVVHIEAQN